MFSKKTATYSFPQWEYSDHPDFLNDMNPAYKKIDEALAEAEKSSSEAKQEVMTLSPIVASHTQSIADDEHKIADLTTRVGNLEHGAETTDSQVQAVMNSVADVNLTIAGFSPTNTVRNTTDTLQASIDLISQERNFNNIVHDTGRTWGNGKKIYQVTHQTLEYLSNHDFMDEGRSSEQLEFKKSDGTTLKISDIDEIISTNISYVYNYDNGGYDMVCKGNGIFIPVEVSGTIVGNTPDYTIFTIVTDSDLETICLAYYQSKGWGNHLKSVKITPSIEFTMN